MPASVCSSRAPAGPSGRHWRRPWPEPECGSLLLLDSSEMSLFQLQEEIAGNFEDVALKFVLGSIGDAGFWIRFSAITR